MVEAELNDDDPVFVLVYDLSPINKSENWKWVNKLTHRTFFGKFTSMKIFISQGLLKNQQKVVIICMICTVNEYHSIHPVLTYLTYLGQFTKGNIKTKWKALYQDFSGIDIPHYCIDCVADKNGRFNGSEYIFSQFFIFEVFMTKYNITSTAQSELYLINTGL